MVSPDSPSGVLVVEGDMFIVWGIKQFLADLAGRALTIAMLAARVSNDVVLVFAVGRVSWP
jgi:hypothetical protein